MPIDQRYKTAAAAAHGTIDRINHVAKAAITLLKEIPTQDLKSSLETLKGLFTERSSIEAAEAKTNAFIASHDILLAKTPLPACRVVLEDGESKLAEMVSLVSKQRDTIALLRANVSGLRTQTFELDTETVTVDTLLDRCCVALDLKERELASKESLAGSASAVAAAGYSGIRGIVASYSARYNELFEASQAEGYELTDTGLPDGPHPLIANSYGGGFGHNNFVEAVGKIISTMNNKRISTRDRHSDVQLSLHEYALKIESKVIHYKGKVEEFKTRHPIKSGTCQAKSDDVNTLVGELREFISRSEQENDVVVWGEGWLHHAKETQKTLAQIQEWYALPVAGADTLSFLEELSPSAKQAIVDAEAAMKDVYERGPTAGRDRTTFETLAVRYNDIVTKAEEGIAELKAFCEEYGSIKTLDRKAPDVKGAATGGGGEGTGWIPTFFS